MAGTTAKTENLLAWLAGFPGINFVIPGAVARFVRRA